MEEHSQLLVDETGLWELYGEVEEHREHSLHSTVHRLQATIGNCLNLVQGTLNMASALI